MAHFGRTRIGSRQLFASRIGALLIAGVGGLFAAHTAFAASPNGTWLRPSTGGHIQIYSCGGGLGMKVVKSSKKSNVGQVIMCGAKSDGANKWKGDIKNLEDGNTYAGYVTLTGAKSLQLKGCALAGLICKTDTWTKIK